MPAPVIEASGIRRRFDRVEALRGVDLEIRAGESVAVFGPNGAGKTTLLRVLATLLRPSAGSLRLFGEERPGPAARRRIGFVSHGSFLYGGLTARENLRFYARLFGVPGAGERIEGLLEDVGLARYAGRRVAGFSRGMEQRLAFARALLHDPDLLLLDEPFAGLDPRGVGRFERLLGAAHGRGKALLVATHDVARGLELCDRALLLAGGRIAWASGRYVPGPQEMVRIFTEAGE